jgi:hypothetical protein
MCGTLKERISLIAYFIGNCAILFSFVLCNSGHLTSIAEMEISAVTESNRDHRNGVGFLTLGTRKRTSRDRMDSAALELSNSSRVSPSQDLYQQRQQSAGDEEDEEDNNGLDNVNLDGSDDTVALLSGDSDATAADASPVSAGREFHAKRSRTTTRTQPLSYPNNKQSSSLFPSPSEIYSSSRPRILGITNPWSIKWIFSITGAECCHLYIWVIKDLAWVQSWREISIVAGITALLWSLVLLYHALRTLNWHEIWNFVASFLWLFANFW